MLRRVLAALVATAAAGAGVAFATGIASGTPGGSGFDRTQVKHEILDLSVHRVAAPSAPQARALALRAKKKKKQKPVRIKFYETQEFQIGDGEAPGDYLRCPRNHKAIGGYFGAVAVDVALTASFPDRNPRRWFVGVTKFGVAEPNPTSAAFGVVCAQNVR